MPGTRIELVQSEAPRDFKSLASTNSATQANRIGVQFICVTEITVKKYIARMDTV